MKGVSITKEDIPVIGNLFWYGDAVPPPSHGGIQPTGDNDKTALPPIPSLLRFVELVFDDAVMQKQKVGYFYAKRRQLMTEEEGGGDQQQGQTDLSRPSRMVHPKTGLVTVPNYTEFMDIYRLLDHSPQTRHRPRGKREYTTTRGKKKKQTADIVLPPEMEKDSDEDETNKEDDDIKPTTESAAVETTSQLQEGETDDYDDGEEEEAETSSCGSVSSRDVVFMTGVALEQEKSEKRRRKRRRKNEENKNEEENINQEKFVERDEIAPDIDIDRSKGHRMEEKSQRKSKKHQQYEGRSKEYASTNAKEDQHSTFEYEPPSTNVRILMNELRRMLRRPLPALPPLNTGRSINRGTKGL
ncbi:hypothetical protein LSM04_002991 [Trypanosoma melophagium]|uniref:uncharacterized protein n=1 Tax=Trypanosoma melophagium TaxID=715481 RepID=UPI00351AAB58|nr:hypothetical protein LSM04_002991 [Trypanosoma melophagium]